ncbi:hypothetical protein GCM10007973_18200 [Polymorphobacter multimanifer]|uniref:hypothetical protein n=1 Tax=Polymorphobacter multimanifer TaxID=1070431 RepID=UPI00166D67D7|nr:hypothetical protein [Polymorphobacter multimanifer]GGI82111.1 hypothetical protein GCM10007973_18200 [Polymorphobacter multimanifer]
MSEEGAAPVGRRKVEQEVRTGLGTVRWLTVASGIASESMAHTTAARKHRATGCKTRAVREG